MEVSEHDASLGTRLRSGPGGSERPSKRHPCSVEHEPVRPGSIPGRHAAEGTVVVTTTAPASTASSLPALPARPRHTMPPPRPARARLRSILSRLGRIPVNSTATVGRAMLLFGAVIRYSETDAIALRLPFGELIVQAWTLLKVTAMPAILMAIPFGGMVAVQVSGLINQVGANSLVGAASGVGVVRQGAPITAGLLMGGAAASAIASDLGARAIREELDALRVIGIDPVRHLVVPRFLALIILAPVLCAVIIASSVAASFLLSLTVSDVAPGTCWT